MARTLTVLVGALLVVLALGAVKAKPLAQAQIGKIVVTLTDEPCAFTDKVDMAYRGTWKAPDRTFEGCWGINSIGIVMMYFDDKSTAAFPITEFKKMHDA